MANIIIVDENDNEIGVKERTEIDYEVDIYRSTGIWITNSNGDALMAQRSMKKDKDPGLWGPAAAGTIDEGETYESNAYKELEEELGLSGVELTEGPEMYSDVPRRRFARYYLGVSEVKIEDLVLQESEVEAAKWVTRAELIEDVVNNPQNYVPAMAAGLELLGYTN